MYNLLHNAFWNLLIFELTETRGQFLVRFGIDRRPRPFRLLSLVLVHSTSMSRRSVFSSAVVDPSGELGCDLIGT